MWGDKLGTTARLIAVGLLESAAPNAAQGLDHNQDGGEGQRGHRQGRREEERRTPIQRVLTIPRRRTRGCQFMDLSCSRYSGSRCRRREGKKRNSIKSSKLIGLLAKVA